ncbi:hypothetical protein D3C83_137730 [compost metagenome]
MARAIATAGSLGVLAGVVTLSAAGMPAAPDRTTALAVEAPATIDRRDEVPIEYVMGAVTFSHEDTGRRPPNLKIGLAVAL